MRITKTNVVRFMIEEIVVGTREFSLELIGDTKNDDHTARWCNYRLYEHTMFEGGDAESGPEMEYGFNEVEQIELDQPELLWQAFDSLCSMGLWRAQVQKLVERLVTTGHEYWRFNQPGIEA